MENKKFETLHPVEGKKNKPLPIDNYKMFKTAIVNVLKTGAETHAALEASVKKAVGKIFTGNIHWHVMVVKLDLEARKIIQRSKTAPVKYHLLKSSR